ncbi:pyridoxal phosphate-dependent decarboxylase family protein [Amycolatopsis umgeniensis]|uniref:Glutamate/tyrosine decarboxylase-like PLP-dependent enzyme n=1 Tax=Amycolatopsis umgeniensis TaxID=336628 RepID=A0A841B2B8_9PSEU|nr:aminotransferase class V-fold PLP-dependent enzyme [Amycolatopsis umgeniensis]MBB5852980.1 glutamate/tyrosine decarboxylase-like PLP-dependent enzyme [Amycolatopsis umgeniensis]
MSELRDLLSEVAARVADYRESVADAPVFPDDTSGVRGKLGELPEKPTPPADVIRRLADAVEPALVATTGPRYFGFVTGGALEAATAADMLTTGWDQGAFNQVTSPAAAIVEEVAGEWLKDVLGLPSGASFGFVTGGQGANTVCLAAARHHVLARTGWDVERRGLHGAPPLTVVAGEERHATIDRSLRLLGLGTDAVRPVRTDSQGAIDIADLERVLDGPAIVCLQAGNVNTGAFDDFAAATAIAHERGAWVHVDGAFGLWAAATPTLEHLTAGVETVDSWAVDGHKWLNVPYDSGYAFCAHPESHAAAMSLTAAYLTGQGDGGVRAPSDFVPESSRRARGFATWAALSELGRSGVADLVERCCALARRFAGQLAKIEGVTVVNDVVLNQVLVGFGEDTDKMVEAVQRSGECWMGATTWRGRRLMRISVSGWSTTEADVDRAVAAIQAARETTTRKN